MTPVILGFCILILLWPIDSGSNYLPLVQWGKSNSNEGQRALNIGSWDNVMDKSSGTHTEPSPVSSNSFPSSSMSVFNEGSGSQSLQSNWQVLTASDIFRLRELLLDIKFIRCFRCRLCNV
jgi:hypothetical protein